MLALQRTLGNQATAAALSRGGGPGRGVVQRMTETASGLEISLDDLPAMGFDKLAELVVRLQRNEVTATTEEIERIRNRILEVRQIAVDAEIAQLEREIAELEREEEMDRLEEEIAQLEKELAEMEAQERQTAAKAVTAPLTTPQLANLLATPTAAPRMGLVANAAPFVPKSSLSARAPSFNLSAPTFVPRASSLNADAPSFTLPAPNFVPPRPSVAALPPITTQAFEAAQNDNRLTMRAVKWWSSTGYPHHNIEIALAIDGRAWAIAHVKWKDRTGPTAANVSMATFKAADGESIPDGNIWGGSTRDALVGKALEHAATAPGPGAGLGNVWI